MSSTRRVMLTIGGWAGLEFTDAQGERLVIAP